MINKDLLYKIPPDIVIYKILPFIEYNLKTFNVKDLYGYFRDDCMRYPIWRNILIYNKFIEKLESYPCMTSLKIEGRKLFVFNEGYVTDKYWSTIELKEYPLLTFLDIYNCDISELKEYPLLTYLKICLCYNISKLKEYPLLTYLKIYLCDNISKLKEYPLLTSLKICSCNNISKLREYPLLTSLDISCCKYLENIYTTHKDEIRKYIQKYTKK